MEFVLESYKASCHCGLVSLGIKLTKPIAEFTARICRCNYCCQKQLTYLSDPNGELFVGSSVLFEIEQQGSKQAMFYTCPRCKTVMLVAYPFSKTIKGAVNASLIQGTEIPREFVVISPAKLSPEAKKERWKKEWSKVIFS